MTGVAIDTTVWSIFLRRSDLGERHPVRLETRELVANGRAWLIGPIRQELLSGVKDLERFEDLRQRLRAIDDVPVGILDFERAANFSNQCESAGIQGSPADFLLCAVAERLDSSIFTLDRDFLRYAEILPIKLHPLPVGA